MDIQRLRALLRRLVGLNYVTLRSLEAVDATFNEDGSHACGPRLEGLAIELSHVRTPPMPLLSSAQHARTETSLTRSSGPGV